jgi:nucleoside-diphosphate-sugar epimerase
MTLESSNIAIIGASGFIGRNLVPQLISDNKFSTSTLIHKNSVDWGEGHSVNQVKGSLFDKESLSRLIQKDSIVINLAYLANLSLEENLLSLKNIIEVSKDQSVKRIIHCSTAVVSGRTFERGLNEESQLNPHNDYEKNKVALENFLVEEAKKVGIELIILRPTCVFGEHGKNLLKLISDLKTKPSFIRYLKSCLYNNRTMNVVSVKDVCSVLKFLIDWKMSKGSEVFIISDDSHALNNYESIENVFREELGVKNYLFPVLRLPHFILKSILFLLGQSNVDPKRTFSRKKIESIGWKSSINLEEELGNFVKSQRVE